MRRPPLKTETDTDINRQGQTGTNRETDTERQTDRQTDRDLERTGGKRSTTTQYNNTI